MFGAALVGRMGCLDDLLRQRQVRADEEIQV